MIFRHIHHLIQSILKMGGTTGFRYQIFKKLREISEEIKFLKQEILKMNPEIQAALDRQTATILEASIKENEELKTIINAGGSPAEIVAAIDANTAKAVATIDALSTTVVDPLNPPSG